MQILVNWSSLRILNSNPLYHKLAGFNLAFIPFFKHPPKYQFYEVIRRYALCKQIPQLLVTLCWREVKAKESNFKCWVDKHLIMYMSPFHDYCLPVWQLRHRFFFQVKETLGRNLQKVLTSIKRNIIKICKIYNYIYINNTWNIVKCFILFYFL